MNDTAEMICLFLELFGKQMLIDKDSRLVKIAERLWKEQRIVIYKEEGAWMYGTVESYNMPYVFVNRGIRSHVGITRSMTLWYPSDDTVGTAISLQHQVIQLKQQNEELKDGVRTLLKHADFKMYPSSTQVRCSICGAILEELDYVGSHTTHCRLVKLRQLVDRSLE